jgi:hypothetical protein
MPSALIVGSVTNRSRAYPGATDNQPMASCRPTRGWTLYRRTFTVIAIGGGVIMLTAAAAIPGSTSVPLLVFGGGWFLAGLSGVWQLRHEVREIVLDGETVEFRRTNRDIVIPAQEITEIRWPRWGGGTGYLRFRTYSNGVIRTPCRLEGLREFMIELAEANPAVRVS